MVVDADSLVHAPLQHDLAALSQADYGLILRRNRRELYRKILASAVCLAPSIEGQRFAIRISSAMHTALADCPGYHVDQAVLHLISQASAAAQAAALTSRWSDHHYGDDALIWSTKGARKQQFREIQENLSLKPSPAACPA